MKKELLFYSALLSALIAQGADFDRATLDQMLSNLERSKEPKKLREGAMCYSTRIGRDRTEYICPDCGERTYYLERTVYYLESLQHIKKGAEELRKLGLEIEVNEQAFCHKCTPDKLGFYNLEDAFSGVVATNKPELAKEHWECYPGNRVSIVNERPGSNTFTVTMLDCVVRKDEIDKNGILLKDAHLRLKPWTSASLGVRDKGEQLSIRPALPGDDPEWVRVEIPDNVNVREWDKTTTVPKELITDVTRKELIFVHDKTTIAPSWIITINGEKRIIPAKHFDVEILRAFLTNKDRYQNEQEREYSLKKQLPRVKELLGE